MQKYTIGIDVGGTNIKLGLVSQSGRIISRSHLETRSFISNKTKLIDAILGSIQKLLAANKVSIKQVLGIGFGLPGLIDFKKGLVIFLPNIPGWKDVPLKKIIENKLKIATFVDNDVNVITLGEWFFGAGRGYENLVCMTLGTGVGGGLIFDNKLYRGEGFVAGEIGHMPLNETGPVCNCGGRGCFETYVGNQRLLAKAREIFRNNHITLPDIRKMAEKKDPQAILFWQDVGFHIGHGLIGVVNLLNPRLIIIGGGVSNNFSLFIKPVRNIIGQYSMKVQAKMVKIVRAKLGDDAGILGANVLVQNALAK
jgi:glucokinase